MSVPGGDNPLIFDQIDKDLFLSLLYWYRSGMIRFKPNKIATAIIREVILSEITKQLDIVVGTLFNNRPEFQISSLSKITDPIWEDIEKLYSNDYFLTSNQFLIDLVRKLICSLVTICKAPMGPVDPEVIEELEIKANEFRHKSDSIKENILDKNLMKLKDLSELIDIYKRAVFIQLLDIYFCHNLT